MKYISQIFTPTNNRRLNELIGFLLCVSALLLFLALASYSPLDPSFNSASVLTGSRAARNWIGIVGALVSDLVLQGFGMGAFLLPVFRGCAGRPLVSLAQIASPIAKILGRTLADNLRSRAAGASARPFALDECHPDRRTIWQDRRRFSHPLLQPGGSLHRLRERPGGGACISRRRSLSRRCRFGRPPVSPSQLLCGIAGRIGRTRAPRSACRKNWRSVAPRPSRSSRRSWFRLGPRYRPSTSGAGSGACSNRHRPNLCGRERRRDSVSRRINAGPQAFPPKSRSEPTAPRNRRPPCPALLAVSSCLPVPCCHRPDEQQAVDADELKLLAQVLTDKYAEFDVHGQSHPD